MGLLLGLAWTSACQGSSSAPEDAGKASGEGGDPSLADPRGPGTSPDALAREGFAAEPPAGTPQLWGGWHRVPYDPTVGSALRRARALADMEDGEGAIAALNLGLERSPSSPALFEARGALYAALGFQRAAERDLETAVRLVPDRPGVWCALGRVRQELGLPRAALTALESARELGCDAPELHWIWARALRRLGHRGEAAARYARAIRLTEDASIELLLEAASLGFRPYPVPSETWLRAQEQCETPALRTALERGTTELEEICGRHDERDPGALGREFSRSGLGRDELEAWTRVALVAVALDDPVPAKRAPTDVALGTRNPGEDGR